MDLKNILCCPICRSSVEFYNDRMTCLQCQSDYPIVNNIFCLLPQRDAKTSQDSERLIRERVARAHEGKSKEEIVAVVAEHHCVPIMSQHAREYRSLFSNEDVVADIGCGTGYYWEKTSGAKIVLIDFAFHNLLSAQKILGMSEDIIFVQADASCLPLRTQGLSGVWSVQVTQHFPEDILKEFIGEIKRCLANKFCLEIYNLNPSLFHKFIYWIAGKKFHIKGQCGEFLINKYNYQELVKIWTDVFPEGKIKIAYSELFFHPEIRLRPQLEWICGLERIFAMFPSLASLFARQNCVRVCSGRKVLS